MAPGTFVAFEVTSAGIFLKNGIFGYLHVDVEEGVRGAGAPGRLADGGRFFLPGGGRPASRGLGSRGWMKPSSMVGWVRNSQRWELRMGGGHPVVGPAWGGGDSTSLWHMNFQRSPYPKYQQKESDCYLLNFF